MHLVQTFSLLPEVKVAHWRLGCLLVLPVGLNLVARTLLLYPPAIKDVLLQIGHDLAIIFYIISFSMLSYTSYYANRYNIFHTNIDHVCGYS